MKIFRSDQNKKRPRFTGPNQAIKFSNDLSITNQKFTET